MGYLTDRQIVHALCSQLGYESIHLSRVRIEDEVIKLADESVWRKYSAIPFGFSEKNPGVLKLLLPNCPSFTMVPRKMKLLRIFRHPPI